MRVGFVIDYQNFHLTAHHHFHGNSVKQNSKNYTRNLSQKSEWTKDPRVEVEYLELKYRDRLGLPPQEKGIDVLAALNFVEWLKVEIST